MSKYLFSVSTEYHLLLALSIIEDIYSENSTVTFDVLLLHSGAKRLSEVSSEGIENLTFYNVDTSDKQQVLSVIQYCTREQYAKFYFFYEFSVINSYLVSRLKKNTTISLGEDGTAIYQQYHVKAWGSRIKQTLGRYKESFRLGIFHWSMPWETLNHGTSIACHETWLTWPELVRKKNNSSVFKINLLDTERKRELTAKVFNFSANDLDVSSIVLYLGRVSYSAAYLEKEIEILDRIVKLYSDRILLLKPHPLTPIHQIERYKQLKGVMIYQQPIPAELLMAHLKESSIYGVDSTALYYNNPSCIYFSLYSYLQEVGVYPEYRQIPFPPHVNMYEG